MMETETAAKSAMRLIDQLGPKGAMLHCYDQISALVKTGDRISALGWTTIALAIAQAVTIH